MDNPFVLEETENFAVVFKPPKMHTTLKHKNEQLVKKDNFTLLEWYIEHSPMVFDVLHRLDFETNGLVLFAKNEKTYNFFKLAQDKGQFIKEYSAVCVSGMKNVNLIGFPEIKTENNLSETPFVIESYFRPFGPGRKLVRPVIEDGKKHKEIAKDKGSFYQTQILNVNGDVFTVQIKRGFRHQIRCHLCWIGFPIHNDPLYFYQTNEDTVSPIGFIALRSHALFFPDPLNGEICEVRIPPLSIQLQEV